MLAGVITCVGCPDHRRGRKVGDGFGRALPRSSDLADSVAPVDKDGASRNLAIPGGPGSPS